MATSGPCGSDRLGTSLTSFTSAPVPSCHAISKPERGAFEGKGHMAKTTLTISSKNYSSWSLRGWLLSRFSGLEFEEIVTAPDDPSARAEILLLSSSILVPCLRHEGATVWDTLAIAEYLNEICPDGGPFPFGKGRTMADAMYAPVVTRFATYDVKLEPKLAAYAKTIMGMPEMRQ